jgi:hypothetical protein
MAGRYLPLEGGVCFIPRFRFVDGTAYTIEVDGVVAASLFRPEPDRRPVTEVVGIWPTADVVPRNLLRLYVWFSSPMSEGQATEHVRLLGGDGATLDHPFFSLEHELWDRDRRRLTILLDPARIKRGLVPHQELGYPLAKGESVRLVVDAGFRDARDRPLRAGAERAYRVGPDERRRVDPAAWDLEVPAAGTLAHLDAHFDRPLDQALLARCLTVEGPAGGQVPGRGRVGPDARSWTFQPQPEWAEGLHHLVVDAILEDLAGNSVRRVFDRDLGRPEDDPVGAEPVRLELAIN